jgi:hypothetical protein
MKPLRKSNRVPDRILPLLLYLLAAAKISGERIYFLAAALPLTPRFSEVRVWGKYKNRFNGLRLTKRVRAETVETVSVYLGPSTTPLKRGVNETEVKLPKDYGVGSQQSRGFRPLS